MTLKRYVIERDIVGVGAMNRNELADASETSNSALTQLSPRVQWEHSYVAGDKTFCVYLAEDTDAIRRHAEISGIIDPTTANRPAP